MSSSFETNAYRRVCTFHLQHRLTCCLRTPVLKPPADDHRQILSWTGLALQLHRHAKCVACRHVSRACVECMELVHKCTPLWSHIYPSTACVNYASREPYPQRECNALRRTPELPVHDVSAGRLSVFWTVYWQYRLLWVCSVPFAIVS